MMMWTVHLEGGPRRVNHAAVAINEKIYSFGGYCTGEDYDTRLPIDVHVLDILSLRWRLLPQPTNLSNVPYQRYGHSTVAYGDNVYLWGGRNDSNGACNILYMYNTLTREWSQVKTNGAMPSARDGHSATVINGKMYIYGGYEEAMDKFTDDVYSYTFETKTWTYIKAKGSPARWRDFHTAIGVGKIMYIFGGRSDVGGDVFTNHELYCNKMQLFDTETSMWRQPFTHGRIPEGRRSHSVFTCKQYIYIFGGYNGHTDRHFNDIFRFDTTTDIWTLMKVRGEAPCARRRQCCCLIGSKLYLFGGTSPLRHSNTDSHNGEIALQDLSDLYVLDLEPSLKTLAQMAVLKYKLDTSCLPQDLKWELHAMTTPNNISRPLNFNG